METLPLKPFEIALNRGLLLTANFSDDKFVTGYKAGTRIRLYK